jgi:hypothetical protein
MPYAESIANGLRLVVGAEDEPHRGAQV